MAEAWWVRIQCRIEKAYDEKLELAWQAEQFVDAIRYAIKRGHSYGALDKQKFLQENPILAKLGDEEFLRLNGLESTAAAVFEAVGCRP